ncbi:MAG: phosphoglycerate dehydrogenase [Elusimicrobiota bacterium]|jgi:D-3-phosphoglycerate dehydrogenase|nr:phosphoglycerate dehydrogenase [Elusimicrobiota bacterium]
MYKILMTYDSKEGLEKLFENKDFVIDIRPKPSPEEFKKIIKNYDGLLIRSEVKVTADIIEAADKLKFIGRAGTGVDNVDKNTATQKGIVVANVPGGNTISAAEHTIGLILSMARNIPEAYQSLKSKKWDRKNFMGTELCGKYLGLIGLGRIGIEVAKRMIAFGMKVVAYDPFANDTLAGSYNIDLIPLDDVLINADYISIHCPLNDATKGMINAQAISKMKDGVRIVNCARGPIINEKDLAQAVSSGKVKGAALDVFVKEPPEDWTIIETDNVIATPHLAASTEEAQIKIAKEMSDVIIDFFTKGLIRNAVNVPTVDWETYKKMKPYIDLASKIGLFQGQVIEGGIKGIEIKYCGNLSSFNTGPLTIAFLQGLLLPMLNIKVNFVNALTIAKERGIKIKESKEIDSEDYAGLIVAAIETDKGECKVLATMFSDTNPRIVNINGLGVDITPCGGMILITNEDKPGVVGNVGKVLGDSGVNIAGMNLGRKDVGGEALTIIEVDDSVSSEVIEKILKIGGIKKVKYVDLEIERD